MATTSKHDAAQALEYLRDVVDSAPRDSDNRPRLVFDVRTVARSGMSRRIAVYVVTEGRGVRNVSYLVAQALGASWNDDGVRIDGCGMDMRFHLANRIAHALGVGDGNDIAREVL